MEQTALLIVSFGTSVEETRKKTIGALEEELKQAFPHLPAHRAYTSPTIRRILAKRGEQVPSPQEAMEQLAAQGVRTLYIQPTHLICGEEYHALSRQVAEKAALFERVVLGRPLLYDMDDCRRAAEALLEDFSPEEEEALVFMGHGTEHPANAVYPAIGYIFHLLGRRDVFVGTVEGWPQGEDVLEQVQKAGFRRVLLAPMMLVAGDHARNDMAGEEDSWKALFEKAGLSVRCALRGMGEIPAVRQIYVDHCRKLLETGEQA